MKIGIEEQEELISLMDQDGWPILMRLLDDLCGKMGSDVLKWNTGGSDLNALLVLQSKYAGARKLTSEMASILGKIKATPNK